jgi:hypothetical protein
MRPQQVPEVRLFQPLANYPWKLHPTLCHPEKCDFLDCFIVNDRWVPHSSLVLA